MGDPETQPILMRLKSDLVDVLLHATDGTLEHVWYKISPKDTPVKLLEALG